MSSIMDGLIEAACQHRLAAFPRDQRPEELLAMAGELSTLAAEEAAWDNHYTAAGLRVAADQHRVGAALLGSDDPRAVEALRRYREALRGRIEHRMMLGADEDADYETDMRRVELDADIGDLSGVVEQLVDELHAAGRLRDMVGETEVACEFVDDEGHIGIDWVTEPAWCELDPEELKARHRATAAAETDEAPGYGR